MCNLYSLTKGQQAIREFAGAMSDRTGNLPPLPGIFPDYAAPDRPQSAGRPRTHDGALGHAVAGLRAQRTQLRSGRHQHPQRQVAALAALARRRAPLRRAVHELQRERDLAGWQQAAGLVRVRRDPAARLLRRHLDALDLGPEGQGRRDDERSLRVSDDRTQQGGRRDPSEGDAGHSDDAARRSISG